MQINSDDIILYRLTNEACASPRPKPGDDPSLTALKVFVMACLHRRNMDPDFDRDMRNWLDTHTEEELASASGTIGRLN